MLIHPVRAWMKVWSPTVTFQVLSELVLGESDIQVAPDHLRHVLKGVRNPSYPLGTVLARITGIPVDDIMSWGREPLRIAA
jgi:hypothetical protein